MRMTTQRGCGEREAGGLYAICELGENGKPVEHFLIDSPIEIPQGQGIDLVNKPQLWQDPRTGIYHLLIWVGAKHYPYAPDFWEEVRHYGASRRIGGLLEVHKLTPGQSEMIFVHPRVINPHWQEQRPPRVCVKRKCKPSCRTCERKAERMMHDQMVVEASAAAGAGVTVREATNLLESGAGEYHEHEYTSLALVTVDAPRALDACAGGECLTKLYELIPESEGEPVSWDDTVRLRTIGSTLYAYTPTGERGICNLKPGAFLRLPLHGFDAIKYQDGTLSGTQEQFKGKAEGAGWTVNEEVS